ncbi:MAG: N4-gp56 family major capsid protein [Dehalococcoidia bacterium]
MATAFPSTLTVQHWAETTFLEMKEKLFFAEKGMMGGADQIIHEITELKNNPGDQVTFQLLMKIDGGGVSGDSQLEGNEETLTYYTDSVTVDLLRNAIEEPGQMAQKRVRPNARKQSRTTLSTWDAERTERAILKHMVGDTSETFPAVALAPSTNRHIFAGTASAESALTANQVHRMTLEEVSRVKNDALTADLPLRPLKIGGEEIFVMLMHPWQIYNMKWGGTGTVSAQWRQAQEQARERGGSNPLFTGAVGMWDGVVIHEHRMLPIFTTGSGSTTVIRAPLLGQNAISLAFGSAPFWNERIIDYDNRRGVSYGKIWGVKKAVFNSEDYGVFVVSTQAQAPSGTAHS